MRFDRILGRCTSTPKTGYAGIELVIIMTMTTGLIIVLCSNVGTSTKSLMSDSASAIDKAIRADRNSESIAIARKADDRSESVFGESSITSLVAISVLTAMTFVAFLGWVRIRRRAEQTESEEAVMAPICQQTQKRIFAKRDQTMAILSRHLGMALVGEMKVKHLISDKANSILPTTPISEIRTLILDNGFRHLLVCDAKGELTGIISDRDLAKKSDGVASDIMTANPICVSSKQELNPVITLMMDRKISCLPVVDDGVIAGILTSTDLMIALQCTLRIVRSIADLATDNPSQ